MPIYEYSCEKCGEAIERIQKFSDAPLKTHSECGGTLTKLISRSAFQLKGAGWYVTDYARKDSGSKAEDSGSSADSKSDSDSGSKSEKTKGKSDKKEKSSAPTQSSGDGNK